MQLKYPFIVTLLIFILLIGNSCTANEEFNTNNLVTIKGKLIIFKKFYKKGILPDYIVKLDDRIIIPATLESTKIIKGYPVSNPKYIVLQLITGGSGCPAYYKVIDLSLNKVNIHEVSDNCSDIIRTEYLEEGRVILYIGNEKWEYYNHKFNVYNPTAKRIETQKLKKRLVK